MFNRYYSKRYLRMFVDVCTYQRHVENSNRKFILQTFIRIKYKNT